MSNDLAVDTSTTDARIERALVAANAINIITTEDYTRADAFCKGLFDLRKAIKADFADSRQRAKEVKDAAAVAYTTLAAQEDSHTKPIQHAELIFKTKMKIWRDEQEAIRRREQDRLRAESLKKAEDERLRQAMTLESQGKTEQAQALVEKPIKATPIFLAPAPVERETVISEFWAYAITDPVAVMREYCQPAPGAIQRAMQLYKSQGKSIEETEALIGGIRIERKIK